MYILYKYFIRLHQFIIIINNVNEKRTDNKGDAFSF